MCRGGLASFAPFDRDAADQRRPRFEEESARVWKTHPRAAAVPTSGTVELTEQYKFLRMNYLGWRRGWDSFPASRF
jgi:hypothetical protein